MIQMIASWKKMIPVLMNLLYQEILKLKYVIERG